MFFTIYKGHEIVSSGDNFRIKAINGDYIGEVAASVATARKWIDALPVTRESLHGIEAIKKAVDAGKRVKCETDAYDVIKDEKGQYLIVCNLNGYTTALHGLPGTKYEKRLNGNLFYFV